jgi:hypothetical protein
MEQRLYYYNNVLYFKLKNIWLSDLETIKAHLYIELQQNLLSNSSIIKRTNELIKGIKSRPQCPILYNSFTESTRGRICFIDGVLCSISKRFYEWDDIDFEYNTTVQIRRCFKEYFNNPNRELIDEIKDKFFYPIFNERMDDYCIELSKILFGLTENNKVLMISGCNCGGSSLTHLYSHSFSNYVEHCSIDEYKTRRVNNTIIKKVRNFQGRMIISQDYGGTRKLNTTTVNNVLQLNKNIMLMCESPMHMDGGGYGSTLLFESNVMYVFDPIVRETIEREKNSTTSIVFLKEEPGIINKYLTNEYENSLIYLLYELQL